MKIFWQDLSLANTSSWNLPHFSVCTVHWSPSLWAYPRVYTVFMVGSRVALAALFFGPICDITRQSLAQTQETTHTGPPWALKLRWRYISNPCRVTFSCPPRRRCCSYVWLLRQPLQGPGLLARPHHNPPTPSPPHLLPPQPPSKACWVRCTILCRVCHVNSVDWSAQQSYFLEERPLLLALLLLPTLHTYSPAASL